MSDRSVATVRDCMQPVRLRMTADTDLLEAMDGLIEQNAAAAAVVDEQDRLLGVLTEKDCLRAIASAAYDNVEGAGVAGDYMSPVPTPLTPDMDMLRAIEIFLAGNFPLLPVVDGDKLVGRVRRADLVAAVRDMVRETSTARRQEASRADVRNRPRGIEAMQRTAGHLGRDVLAQIFSRRR